MLAQKLGLSLPTIKTVSAGFENLYSLDFDGVDDNLNMGDANVFTPNNSGAGNGFSVSFWIKTSRDRIGVLGKADSTTTMEWTVSLGAGGGTVQFTVFSGGDIAVSQALITNSAAVGDGAWHHVVCTWDLGNNIDALIIFIDGTEYSKALANASYGSNGAWSGMTNTTSDLLIGAGVQGFAPFEGKVDELAIFDDELKLAAVTEMYNSGTPTDLSGVSSLLGYWRNGDPTGTAAYPTITDDSSNSNDGTMTNMASGDIVTDAP